MPEKKNTFADTIRFYLTALSVLAASFSSFAFLFLVPFVIDPAFSTLFAEFEDEPAICVTTSSEFKKGMSNCTWSSCREGCTRDIFKCTQILVNYKIGALQLFESRNYTDEYTVAAMSWDFEDAKLYPNIKGCGYPPEVNCTEFDMSFSSVGTTFPCYYSKLMPEMTLTYLDIDKIKLDLIYAIAIPWGAFLVSILYLLITYAGMSRPDAKNDEPQEITASKASKDASNYSLRSLGKSINQGVNKFREDQDDKGGADGGSSVSRSAGINGVGGASSAKSALSSSLTPVEGNNFGAVEKNTEGCANVKDKNVLLEPANLPKLHGEIISAGSLTQRKAKVLPPIERTPPSRSTPTREKAGEEN